MALRLLLENYYRNGIEFASGVDYCHSYSMRTDDDAVGRVVGGIDDWHTGHAGEAMTFDRNAATGNYSVLDSDAVAFAVVEKNAVSSLDYQDYYTNSSTSHWR